MNTLEYKSRKLFQNEVQTPLLESDTVYRIFVVGISPGKPNVLTISPPENLRMLTTQLWFWWHCHQLRRQVQDVGDKMVKSVTDI